MSNLQAEEYKNFEEIKKIREDGTEYWNARELSEVLQYKKWEKVADYFNQLDEDNKRLVIRGDIKQWNQMLLEKS